MIHKMSQLSTVLLGMYRSVYDRYAPDAVLDPNAPKHWQETVLYLFVLVAVSVGFVALVLGMVDNVKYEYWYIFFACLGGYLAHFLQSFFVPAVGIHGHRVDRAKF
jgi:hypothetical protein